MTTEIMGYNVEWTGDDKAPAILHGSRGATYGVMRPVSSRDDWCYLIDVGHRSAGTMRRIKGNTWLLIPRGEQRITGAR